MTAELLRAIRTESSIAIQFWWGVGADSVWRWRKAFGVTKWGTAGSRRLHQALSEQGAAKARGKKLPRALVERRVATRRQRRTQQWQQWQLDLLGTVPDAELVARFGRTINAVRVMRNR